MYIFLKYQTVRIALFLKDLKLKIPFIENSLILHFENLGEYINFEVSQKLSILLITNCILKLSNCMLENFELYFRKFELHFSNCQL